MTTVTNEAYLRQITEQDEAAETLSEILERDSRRFSRPLDEESEAGIR